MIQSEPQESAAKVDGEQAQDRIFRDSFIEKEELRWNDAAKQDETIRKEKEEMGEGLTKYAGKIEKGIKSMEQPLAVVEDLPQFLRDCGVDESTVSLLRDSLAGKDTTMAPKHKHGLGALFEAINELSGNSSFPEGSFFALVLKNFEIARRATFVDDDIRYVKHLDRRSEGFYRSPEGEEMILQHLHSGTNVENESAA